MGQQAVSKKCSMGADWLVQPQVESASGVNEEKRILDLSMKKSTPDWSLDKVRGRQRGDSKEYEDFMHEDRVESSSQHDHAHTQ